MIHKHIAMLPAMAALTSHLRNQEFIMTTQSFGQAQYEQAPKRKMSSLLITGVLHALALGLGLQATNVIDIRPPTIIELTTVKPPVKTPEPEKRQDLPKSLPTIPVIPPPFVRPERDDGPVITVAEKEKVEPGKFEPTPPPNNGGGNGEVAAPRAPVHIAAQVDSNACEKPDYPANSLRIGEEGTVNLAMLIGPDGRVLESKVEKSSGSRALDKAAIQGLSLCKFKPGSVDGVAEKSWAKLQYVWSIN
jgi:protein TonB